jgi:hypothetical protein
LTSEVNDAIGYIVSKVHCAVKVGIGGKGVSTIFFIDQTAICCRQINDRELTALSKNIRYDIKDKINYCYEAVFC